VAWLRREAGSEQAASSSRRQRAEIRAEKPSAKYAGRPRIRRKNEQKVAKIHKNWKKQRKMALFLGTIAQIIENILAGSFA